MGREMSHAEYVMWAAFYTWEAHEKKKAVDKASKKKR
jgi:hypothetical protein